MAENIATSAKIKINFTPTLDCFFGGDGDEEEGEEEEEESLDAIMI
jgi:hypothetical protein